MAVDSAGHYNVEALKKMVMSSYFADKEYCVRKEGMVLPHSTVESLDRMYGKRVSQYAGIRMSLCRTHFVLPDGRIVTQTELKRVFGTQTSPFSQLVSHLSFPNGQVKNFMNACRACTHVGDEVHVAVVGSKSSEGGGLWHKYFALYLAQRSQSVVIDFYDYSERNSEWQMEYQGATISCEWIAAPRTKEQLQERDYDVIVDDVWTYETGSGLGALPSKHFSMKGLGDGFQPYLHVSESRRFSHPPLAVVKSPCTCMVCEAASEVSETYEQFLFVRSICARLGHKGGCVGISYEEELVACGQLHRELLRAPVVQVRSSSLWRFVIALSEEIPLALDGRNIWQKPGGDPELRIARRFRDKNKKLVDQLAEEKYEWLEGRSVVFCGVPVTVIGTTKIKTGVGSAAPGMADVMFANSKDTLRMNFSSNVVYLPCADREVEIDFPGWRATGRSVREYREFAKRGKDSVQVQLVERAPGLYFKGSRYAPVDFYPWVDISILEEKWGERGEKPNGKVEGVRRYTFVREKCNLRLAEFDPEQWRMSIWLDGSNRWGWLRDYVVDSGVALGAVKVYWDVTLEELKRLEGFRHPTQQLLRRYFSEGKQIDEQFLQSAAPIDGWPEARDKCRNWRYVLATQLEFKVDVKAMRLRRDVKAVYAGLESEHMGALYDESRFKGYAQGYVYYYAIRAEMSYGGFGID